MRSMLGLVCLALSPVLLASAIQRPLLQYDPGLAAGAELQATDLAAEKRKLHGRFLHVTGMHFD